jgi:uncharacterized beta-barrel protein YwiB (DUF1934 family)
MKKGFLTIVTTVDGTESRFSSKAEMEIASVSAVLCYKETNAIITITVDRNEVLIERKGHYDMHLLLRENERTNGVLSIAGNEGNIEIFTERLAYSIGKNSLLMQIYYTLIFGKEKQDMRLRINASQTSLEEK